MLISIKIQEYLNDFEINKFWSKVKIINDDNSCWLWTGATKDKTQENSYGVINIGHKQTGKRSTVLAHRISWVIENKKEPDGVIDHQCFNRRCVRPSHLKDMTWSENAGRHEQQFLPECKNGHKKTKENTKLNNNGHKICMDCVRVKDRLRYKEKYAKDKLKYKHTSEMQAPGGGSKLTWKQVCEIRKKYLKPEYSQSKLAIEYKVSKTMIGYIVNNKTRKEK